MDDDSDSSEPGPAAKKHVRQLSSDDNCSDQQTEEEKADFLAEAFPNIDREVHCQLIDHFNIALILSNSHGLA